jgi:dihydropyrimidinase
LGEGRFLGSPLAVTGTGASLISHRDAKRRPDLVISNGRLVTPNWDGNGSIDVHEGRIIALRESTEARDESRGGTPQVIDATGMWVLPGGVDPHVHLAMCLGDTSTRDSGQQLAQSALLGGTTTLMIHAIPTRGQEVPRGAMERIKQEMAGVDISFTIHCCIPGWISDPEEELRRCWDLGARTVKIFTTYREELMIDPYQLIAVLAAAERLGMVVLVHAEADDVVQWARGLCQDDDVESFVHLRPEAAEIAAVTRVLAAARLTSASVYFVHLTTAEAVDLVHEARAAGVDALAETCPHYLLLDDSAYAGTDGELFLCSPPLRRRETVERLQEELRRGRLDAVGSDHCGYQTSQKFQGRGQASRAPMGLPGIQLRNSLILDLVARGKLRLGSAAAMLAERPAKVAGIYPKKGVLAVGSDADIVVWDPASAWQVRSSDLAAASDYSPFEAREIRVRPRFVIQSGRVIACDGKFASRGPGDCAALDEFMIGRAAGLQVEQ